MCASLCERDLLTGDVNLSQVALLERPRKANSSRKPLSAELYHMVIKKGANYGEANGLEVTLDIENFNFAYFRASSQGLRVAVHDHRHEVHVILLILLLLI